jgi:hypothetical protein
VGAIPPPHLRPRRGAGPLSNKYFHREQFSCRLQFFDSLEIQILYLIV